ncbi:MAG: hypothetical protein QM636_18315 [Rhizobium sp.]
MADQEFTIARILRDPIIRQVLKADNTSLSDFARLLRDAATRMSDGPARHHGIGPVLLPSI